MNEIKFLKNMGDRAESERKLEISNSSFSQSKEYHSMCQEIQQERERSSELSKELKEMKNKMYEWEQMQIEKQKQDAFETMIVFIEKILEGGSNGRRINPQQKADWEDIVGALLNEYQDDATLLQDKYLQQL